MNLRELMDKVVAYLGLGETTMEVWRVQDAIERAIAGTGRRTKRGRTLAFGNTMLVYLSPEAYDALRPVERQVITEIEQHLPNELERVWKLTGAASLRVALTADPDLQGLHVRVSAAERDVTPDEPLSAVSRSRPDPDATRDLSRVVIREMGPRPRQWTVPTDRRLVLGRRPNGPPGDVKVDVEFENATLSRLHLGLQARRLNDGSVGLEVFDFQSQNGTFIDGKRIPAKSVAHARHGQLIRLGGRSGLTLRVMSAEADPDATQPFSNEVES